MVIKSSNHQNKKYKLVPPDGGWAYVICFACICILAPTSGFRSSFSLMYHDLMEEIELDSIKVGFVAGSNVMCLSISGYLTGPLLKVMSIRQLTLIAAILYNVGAFSSAFTTSFTKFAICQSLIQNFGFGIIYNLTFTCLKDYFIKKRLLAVSFVQTINAIAAVCVPYLIKKVTDVYGHRGMLILLTGFSMHAFIGVSLLQPVAWHMKKEILDSEESKKSSTETSAQSGGEIPSTNAKVIENEKTREANQSSFKLFMKGLIDVNVLKEFGLSRICLGVSTVFVADFLYSLMITKAFYARGNSREYVTSCMTSIATGDLAMRIMFILFSNRLKKLGSNQLYAFGSLLSFIARSGTLLSDNKTSVLICLTVTGIARSFGTTLVPVVIADNIAPENYTSGLGITLLIIGVLNLSLGPITGAVRDYTNSYDVVLWLICCLFLAAAILFAVDIKLKKTKNKTE